jgi:hypothetical protein
MLRYLIFITIGILLYLLLNRYNTFSIGVPHHGGGSSGPGRMATRSPRLGGSRECSVGREMYYIRVPWYDIFNEKHLYYIETPFISEDSAKESIQTALNKYKDKYGIDSLNENLSYEKFSIDTYFVVPGLPNLNNYNSDGSDGDTLFESFPLVFDCLQAVLCKKYGGDIIKTESLGRSGIYDGSYEDLDTYFIEAIWPYYQGYTHALALASVNHESGRPYGIETDPYSYVFLNRLDDAKFNCGSESSCCIMR